MRFLNGWVDGWMGGGVDGRISDGKALCGIVVRGGSRD